MGRDAKNIAQITGLPRRIANSVSELGNQLGRVVFDDAADTKGEVQTISLKFSDFQGDDPGSPVSFEVGAFSSIGGPMYDGEGAMPRVVMTSGGRGRVVTSDSGLCVVETDEQGWVDIRARWGGAHSAAVWFNAMNGDVPTIQSSIFDSVRFLN